MSITYTWSLDSVKVKDEFGHQDVVVQTHWTKTGTDEGGVTATFRGATPFTAEDFEEDYVMVPASELTADIVLGWIKKSVEGKPEAHINFVIEESIGNKVNPIHDLEIT